MRISIVLSDTDVIARPKKAFWTWVHLPTEPSFPLSSILSTSTKLFPRSCSLALQRILMGNFSRSNVSPDTLTHLSSMFVTTPGNAEISALRLVAKTLLVLHEPSG
jgi:hypothetical protein